MDTTSIIFVFIIGTLFGSFINVIALRYNTGKSSINSRSVCFNCNTRLSWYELIPIFSFLFLRGKCKECKTKISYQYILVEILTGLAFVFIALRQISLWHIYGQFDHGFLYSILFFIYYCFIFSLLLVISLYDIKHKIIPNKLVYTFVILSFIKLALFFYCNNFVFDLTNILNLFAPFILFTLFASIWFFSGGRMMGFGDAKLVLGVGALLGFVSSISAIILAFWIGSVWGLLAILANKFHKAGYFGFSKKINMSSEIPFAPFIVLGTFIIFIFQIDILALEDFISYLS